MERNCYTLCSIAFVEIQTACSEYWKSFACLKRRAVNSFTVSSDMSSLANNTDLTQSVETSLVWPVYVLAE